MDHLRRAMPPRFAHCFSHRGGFQPVLLRHGAGRRAAIVRLHVGDHAVPGQHQLLLLRYPHVDIRVSWMIMRL